MLEKNKRTKYYGFINDNDVLKLKTFYSKNSMDSKSKLQRNENLKELFVLFFDHFKKMDNDDDISDRIINRHAIMMDMGTVDFVKGVKKLYKAVLEKKPELFI